MPRFLLASAFGHVMRATESRPVPAGVVSPRDLIPTMHYDAQTVLDAAGPLDRFAGLSCDVLLLGGARSARNLTVALDGLSAVLPPRPPGHPAPNRPHHPRQQRQARTRRGTAANLHQLAGRLPGQSFATAADTRLDLTPQHNAREQHHRMKPTTSRHRREQIE